MNNLRAPAIKINTGKLSKHPVPTQVTVWVYDEKKIASYSLENLLTGGIHLTKNQILWVRVTGLGTTQTIHDITNHFNFHPLAIEDTLNTNQRAKVDNYDGYQFIVSNLLEIQKNTISCQQLSIFLGKQFIVSFLETDNLMNAHFDKNLYSTLGHSHLKGCDYLLYEILDYATDRIFPVLETYNDYLDRYENAVLFKPSESLMQSIQFFKRSLRTLRQLIWANRDMLSMLMRNELGLLGETTHLFIRDCYDHSVRQMDLLESQRESALSLIDIYLSSTTNRVGQVMKILTGISIIFMPPTFLATVWGMNFKEPEFQWAHGYLFSWTVMLIVSIIPSIWFWRKGWLKES